MLFLRCAQLVPDGTARFYSLFGLVPGCGFINGKTSILHITSDYLYRLGVLDVALQLLHIGEKYPGGGKIHLVDPAQHTGHFKFCADGNVIGSSQFLENFAVFVEQDILTGLPQLFSGGNPQLLFETGDGDRFVSPKLLIQNLCTQQRRSSFCILSIQLEIAVLGKTDQRGGMLLLDGLIAAKCCNRRCMTDNIGKGVK